MNLKSVLPLYTFTFAMLVSCDNSQQPMSAAEQNSIEDKLLHAIEIGKINAYTDPWFSDLLQPEALKNMIPKDSTGRYDMEHIQGITLEEMEVNKGNFTEHSHAIGGIGMDVLFPVSPNEKKPISVGYLLWVDVKKALSGHEEKQLKAMLQLEFDSMDQYDYQWRINERKLSHVIKTLYDAAKSGAIAAYENDNLNKIYNPQELDNVSPIQQNLYIEDTQFPGEFKDTTVISPISADNIVAFQGHGDDDGNFFAYSMMYLIKGFRIPWICLSDDDVKKALNAEMYAFFKEYVAKEDARLRKQLEEYQQEG